MEVVLNEFSLTTDKGEQEKVKQGSSKLATQSHKEKIVLTS